MEGSSELARQIARKLRGAGHQALLVGGCVRDLLLNVQPKDYDLATSATPPEVLSLFPRARQVGAHFGVLLVENEGHTVEVATFRSDHDYSDGRRPGHVKFETNPKEDALRRDFTINALFLDPDTEEIIDYAGGQQDLRIGLVRAIGKPDDRFREDHLRMLRAVRFASRLRFEIESETEAAIVRLHPLIQDVAAERVRDELARILTEGNPRQGFEVLYRTGLLKELLPEVEAMRGVQQPPEFHPEGDVWTHTMIMLEGLHNPSPVLALGVLLHDVGKPPTFRVADRIRFDGHVEAGVEIARSILNRLRFSNDEVEQVVALVLNHMRFKDAPHMKQSTLKRFLRLPEFADHMELHRLDCESSHGHLDNYELVRKKIDEFGQEQLAPPRLLNGRDLMEAGYRPGPEFGRVLNAVEDAQLEGRIETKEQALALARELLGKPADDSHQRTADPARHLE